MRAILLILTLPLCCGSCSSMGRSQAGERIRFTAPTSARDSLLSELRRQARSGSIDPAGVRFIQDSSNVVSGLGYSWAVYLPGYTSHSRLLAVAATHSGIVTVLRRPADWRRATRSYMPTSDSAAIAACAEIVGSTSRRRSPGVRPAVVSDTGSLNRASGQIPHLASLRRRVQAAQVVRDGTRWEVTGWFVEAGDAMKYQCVIDEGATSLRAVDSLPDHGFRGD
jgi:hypothetical protein